MDRQEVERQYSPSRWSRRLPPDVIVNAHVTRTRNDSETAKATLECKLGIPYGPTERQKVDIFGSETLPKDAPIFVYVHGGYWQELGRELSSYPAVPLVKAGAVVVIVGYELAPKVSMTDIVDQVREATRFVLGLAAERGSRGVYICGHSAGAHLTAMTLAAEFTDQQAITPSIKGVVLISGIYDLRPLVDTYVNDPIKMTREEAWLNSPERYCATIASFNPDVDILIVIGQLESPSFHRQANSFSQNLETAGLKPEYVEIPDVDHFDLAEKLSEPDYQLTKMLTNMLKLSG